MKGRERLQITVTDVAMGFLDFHTKQSSDREDGKAGATCSAVRKESPRNTTTGGGSKGYGAGMEATW